MLHVAVAVAVLLVLLFVARRRSSPRVSVVSAVTGKSYKVLDRPDAQLAADALARLEVAIEDFLAKAELVAPGDRRLANIRRRWSRTFTEIDGTADIAFSSSKADISLCVRRPDGSVHSTRDSMFVTLHELAHVANDEWGHGDSFWEDFRYLLELAERTGVHPFQDLDAEPETYCGKQISSTPMHCVKQGTCVSSLRPIRPQEAVIDTPLLAQAENAMRTGF